VPEQGVDEGGALGGMNKF